MSAGGPRGPVPPADQEPRPAGLRGLWRDLRSLDRTAVVVLVTVPIVLTLLDYYGMPWLYPHGPHQHSRRPLITEGQVRTTDAPLADWVRHLDVPGPESVRHFVWWGAACLLFLVVVPMLVGWFVARLSPRALGLRLRGTGRDAWIYAALFGLFFPVLFVVSLSEDFQKTYPFIRSVMREGPNQDFVVFEVVYCLQFFAVEFFFRGFMVLGLKRALGWASVLVMLAPYCMIHYYKPMPEALGAIGAGLVLGALAWRTGTILYGWALHYAVALSMDLLALFHRDLL